MNDTFKNELNIGDHVAFMHQYYDGKWASFHQGIIIGFTPCFVKIKPDENDNSFHLYTYVTNNNNEYIRIKKPYIMRYPYKIIKLFNE